MKKLALLALVSTPAFAAEVCETTSTSRYCEDAATNTISIENFVDVYSSRQNVWVCGVGIRSTGGSDNRVYFTETKFSDKGRNNTIEYSASKVIEAEPNKGFARSGRGSTGYGDSNYGYFNKRYEVHISNIRAELASLNYGAELYLDICGEAPFSYDGVEAKSAQNGNLARQFNWKIDLETMLLDITDLRTEDYKNVALIEGTQKLFFASELTSLEGRWLKPESDIGPNTPANDGYWTEASSVAGNAAWEAISTTSGMYATFYSIYDNNAGDDNGDRNMRKYVARFTLKETAEDVNRLKGLTEGLQWKQNLSSCLNVTSKGDNDLSTCGEEVVNYPAP
jgi:hypothetical protein